MTGSGGPGADQRRPIGEAANRAGPVEAKRGRGRRPIRGTGRPGRRRPIGGGGGAGGGRSGAEAADRERQIDKKDGGGGRRRKKAGGGGGQGETADGCCKTVSNLALIPC
jgi:hypothetical protein